MSDTIKNYSDAELYAMLRDDRAARAAFEEIYARYASRIFTYCRRILGDSELAEDMFQEAFARFYEGVKSIPEITNIEAYILRIARNLCLNEKKRKSRDNISFEEFRHPVDDTPYESAELLKLIETALGIIGEEYREVYILREFLGMSYQEIAELTNATMPVVKTRIYRAKSQIRDILAPYIEDLHK